MKKFYSIAVLLFIASHAWANGDRPSVPSMLYQPKEDGRLAAAEAFKDAAGTIAAERRVPAYEPDAAMPTGGPKQTGVVHTLSEPVQFDQLTWQALSDGGYAVRVKIQADRARQLRLHLHIRGDYTAIQFRLKGNAVSAPVELIAARVFPSGDIWLPISDGDEAILELYAPSRAAREAMASAVLDRVNYLFAAAGDGEFATLHKAAYTQYDVTCWTNSTDYAALLKGAAATAKINYVSSDGGSYLCTGTLLNDRNGTSTPWFATANHCIGDQAEANSMSLEWFYQAPACGSSSTDSRHKKTYGGGQLLWGNVEYDTTFLKLNSSPPSGVTYAGWDANSLSVGQKIWGIHHPKGDHTMASAGNVAELDTLTQTESGLHTLHNMRYSYGGTEGGSSGSGLFSVDGTTIQWRGTLCCGPSSDYQNSSYSPFDYYYSSIKAYLYPDTTTATFTVNGSLTGESLGGSTLSLGVAGESCTVTATTYSCTIPTSSSATTCGPLIPTIVRSRKSSNSKASAQIVDNFSTSPASFTPSASGNPGSACSGQSFSQNIAIAKPGLSFDEKAAKILDCAERIAGDAFPPNAGYAQYDSLLSDSLTGAASVERSYAATGWGSAVLRLSASDAAANFYYFRTTDGGWTKLGDLETINSLYCQAW